MLINDSKNIFLHLLCQKYLSKSSGMLVFLIPEKVNKPSINSEWNRNCFIV